ncbi:HupE/UreJ family protein [Nostoc sp. FACHB-152]|uniref:HupE/UreJ family protein n=1 Tax=unclassified Nostoc TaxID=2593658 RepID=UPI001684D261|nr:MULTISPECIES: HupE/UreJ family protein [unclassified Nostoc]MBD2450147.1 HupE/UreJ family protein [Nostoc sp. FACHB-152]MBD2471330.1 HupE/UreJ family protein [Nostoc sp. FACHB-145]
MLKDKLFDRLVGAIAALVLISLLSLWSGLPSHHVISNPGDGFLWGMAEPVLSFGNFVSIIAIGLLAARMVSSSWIAISFVLAAILGTVIHLSQISVPGIEIAIAITNVAFGVMLLIPQPKFLILLLFSAIAGLFQGYFSSESIVGADTITSGFYIFGAILTQYAVVMSSKKIGDTLEVSSTVPRIISFVGFAICAVSIVFLQGSFN